MYPICHLYVLVCTRALGYSLVYHSKALPNWYSYEVDNKYHVSIEVQYKSTNVSTLVNYYAIEISSS